MGVRYRLLRFLFSIVYETSVSSGRRFPSRLGSSGKSLTLYVTYRGYNLPSQVDRRIHSCHSVPSKKGEDAHLSRS